MTQTECLLCSATTTEIRVRLVRFRSDVQSRAFEALARCTDYAACRVRLESKGERWPIDDNTPAPLPADLPRPDDEWAGIA